MKRIYLLLLICLLTSSLIGCATKESVNASGISPEQVVRNYFNYWNEKRSDKINALLAPRYKSISWEFDKFEYVKLLKIDQIKAIQDNEVIVEAEFDIKFKSGYGSGLTDGNYTWSFDLKRDNENSPWIICNYGQG